MIHICILPFYRIAQLPNSFPTQIRYITIGFLLNYKIYDELYRNKSFTQIFTEISSQPYVAVGRIHRVVWGIDWNRKDKREVFETKLRNGRTSGIYVFSYKLFVKADFIVAIPPPRAIIFKNYKTWAQTDTLQLNMCNCKMTFCAELN